ncbi:MAG: ATP-binding protein [Pseudomonadota bacterium]
MSEQKHRILVVDDEQGMREGCRRVLESSGFEVEVAHNGERGLELFRKNGRFSAALIDLKMPGMSGLELISTIHGEDRDIILLVITAYAAIDTAVEATKLGAYGYIPKPFTPNELLLAIRNGLEKRALALEAKRFQVEREKQLLELAFERSKSRTIINCMTDGVMVVNRLGKIVLVNSAAVRIFSGLSDFRVPLALDDAIDCKKLKDLIVDVSRPESSTLIETREIPVDGTTYMVNAGPVYDIAGERLGVVAVLRDITALKRLDAAKSIFVSMVAHEVKSPLAAIESFIHVILSEGGGVDPHRDREMLLKALSRSESLRMMISELIDITAIETGNFTFRRAATDVGSMVKEAVELFREKAEAKHIALALDLDGTAESRPVLADRNALAIIMRNLIDNAVKYTPDKGHVNVSIKSDGMYMNVSVRDDGIGMARGEKDKIFDEFYRVKNDYTVRVPGTGLGLTLVKKLVDMHQGKISVQSESGGGSLFRVSLPQV